jgi:hypothetical protein
MTARRLESGTDSYAPARRFSPEQNRQEIDKLYGPEPVFDWDGIVRQAQERSPDSRDKRDPRKLGQRILRKVRNRD